MKKILSISLILAACLAFNSCVQEEDDIFDKSAAERLNEASDVYSKRLMASPNGWAMQLYPTNEDEWPYGNGYLVLCRFNKDYSVDVSMNNIFTDGTYWTETSLWEVLTDNGPVLSFNSHNKCIHAFSDPYDIWFTGTDDHANNESGTGIGGDYEFIIVDAPEDASYMMLKGKKRGTYNLLTSVEMGVDFEDYLTDVKNFRKTYFPMNAPTFDVVHFGDSLCKMEMSYPSEMNGDATKNLDFDGLPNIYPYDGDPIIDQKFNTFLITKRGNEYYLRFRDKIKAGDVEVQEFVYRTEKDIFESVDNPAYYIEGNNPFTFFSSTMEKGSATWILTDQSEKGAAFISQLSEYFTSLSNSSNTVSFGQVQLVPTDQGILLQVAYKNKPKKGRESTGYMQYLYNMNNSGGKFKLTYNKPYGTTSQEENTSMIGLDQPSVKAVVDFFAQEFEIGGGTTAFNLNTVRLSPSSATSSYIIMSKK
ncbi:MAG: DUF4302 domain-containing protein [Prevotella sp.]|nr:DUF4302 domain-containing protein [Prevotella sp.]MBO4658654.1 DUF4302 domain-containing protein [Prevotella sp.]